jgi:hypothetical protein
MVLPHGMSLRETKCYRADPTSVAPSTPLNGRIVLFGGEEAAGFLGDTWEWDSDSGPSPRRHVGMAPFDGKLVLFGGDDASGWVGDTWLWDGAEWVQSGAENPPARYVYTLASR